MPNTPSYSEEQARARTRVGRQKRRLERILIGLAILVIIALTFLQTKVVRLGTDVPATHGVLLFVLINVNILLLFVLLIVVLRNLYKIFFEQRQIFGAQLRTKLVVAFVSLSLVPTGLLFYAGLQFIAAGHESWFNESVENSLVESQALGRLALEQSENLTRLLARRLAGMITSGPPGSLENAAALEEVIQSERKNYGVGLVEIYSPGLEVRFSDRDERLTAENISPPPAELFRESAAHGRPVSLLETLPQGELIRVVWPVRTEKEGLTAFLVAGTLSKSPIKKSIGTVTRGLDGYRQLKRLKDPLRVSHYLALTIVALLSIFVSTWIGFHLAKGITGPIMELAAGTDRLAHGDYEVTIDPSPGAGEIRTLVESFNRMTRDLKAGRTQLTQKHLELQRINTELDQRRRYMEIILQNVAAGVISADAAGVITTINDSAEEILQLKSERILGRPFLEIMAPEHKVLVNELITAAETSARGSAERQVQVRIGGRMISLHVHLSRLLDEYGNYLGLVLVFDDLTELEKVQRMTAWRQVARRIAHEIKNPLTPIQLSTQRLRRRYADRLADDGQLFDECTQMIIRQVEELKRLVGEFSKFARMPQADLTPNDLAEIIEETLVLFEEGHPGVGFFFHKLQPPPVFNLDREQMKRAMINLLDNAVAAVENHGHIDITLDYDPELKIARLEVADDGVGISPADKQRLFEPYFSTKKAGTGLGLAIVSSIIADHDGFIRVLDNQPRGTRFVLELPVKN
ncbi:MAG: ATP-binding protein [Thermodesulfobacteriota bacterium]